MPLPALGQQTHQVPLGIEESDAVNILESSISRCFRPIDKKGYVDVLLLSSDFSILLDMEVFVGLKAMDQVIREGDTNNDGG